MASRTSGICYDIFGHGRDEFKGKCKGDLPCAFRHFLEFELTIELGP